jgi:hypothetical protein
MPNEAYYALDPLSGLAGRLFPDIITVRLGLPVRLYHMSVSGDHQVSVEALAAEAITSGPDVACSPRLQPVTNNTSSAIRLIAPPPRTLRLIARF